ncbi:hypothetical protein FRB95_010855 [Tulasnella sp. JGI-2019a]|nr:hypothetical protein FRB95_010855 [Tulasnella sp. JGI-2019a]
MSREREEKIEEAVQLMIEAWRKSPMGIDTMGELAGDWRNEDFGTCLQQLKTKFYAIMAHRNRSRNHSLPLYRLPLEILIKVLSLALPDAVSSRFYMERLRKFASVSHQWWLLVIGTPSSWKVASSDLPLELLRQVLSRSTGHRLDVIDISYGGIPINKFIALVVEHVHRWQSLLVLEDGHGRRVEEWRKCLASLSLPALEVLTLKVSSHTADVVSWEAKNLRCLELWRVCIPWESKMLSGLQKLELVDPGPRGPSRAQLLAILAASPGLVEFKLKGFKQSEDNSNTSSQAMSVELLMLKTLSIEDSSQELVHRLLAAIHTPQSTKFTIDYYQGAAVNLSLLNDPALAHIASVLIVHL